MTGLIVALDVPSSTRALALVERLGDVADFYKVGAQLFTADGPAVVRELRARGKRVFLDLKFHDIPNTVARAVESAATLGVDMLTLHAAGGSAMLRAARDAGGRVRLIAVTMLTSFGPRDAHEVWGRQIDSLVPDVDRLAALAADAGMDGVVASVLELETLRRRHGGGLLVVTPGIRPAGADPADQVRTATPADAVRAGADFIVVGRPITEAADVRRAASAVVDELAGVEATR